MQVVPAGHPVPPRPGSWEGHHVGLRGLFPAALRTSLPLCPEKRWPLPHPPALPPALLPWTSSSGSPLGIFLCLESSCADRTGLLSAICNRKPQHRTACLSFLVEKTFEGVILFEMFNSLVQLFMFLEGNCPSVASITSFALLLARRPWLRDQNTEKPFLSHPLLPAPERAGLSLPSCLPSNFQRVLWQ